MQLADIPTIECHPPDRRRRTEIRMCHGSCCCCYCCCCLHTVGGIVGAIMAAKKGEQSTAWSHLSLLEYWDEEENEPGPAPGASGDHEAITAKVPTRPARPTGPAGAVPYIAKSGLSAVKMFWLLSLAGALIGATAGDDLAVALLILGLGFPAVQLACAIITWIWLGFSSRSWW